ncbi:MAG: Crp/Fnr family transcriptional regulator [Litoreibacter sp.]|nr:Crp/Fnr family transcriptional regulator [Litoreibacter sp.]
MTFVFNERESCSKCPIRHRAVCARCDTDELELLDGMKSYQTIAAGEPIIWRGDELTHFSSVVAGIASLSRTLEDGRIQMVGLLLPSDFIGRPGRETVEFDVTAVSDVTLCRFERKPFENLVEDVPHISQRVMEMALDELNAAREWMVLLGRKTAREKIATFLDMVIRRDTTPLHGAGSHSLPLTREEIANFLGLTLETVSRQLSAMKKEKILTFSDRRNFTILDLDALQEATGDDTDNALIA